MEFIKIERNPLSEFYKLPANVYDVVSARRGDILIHESDLCIKVFVKRKECIFI